MKWPVEYAHPLHAIPLGKRIRHHVYVRRSIEIEFEDVPAGDVEAVVDFDMNEAVRLKVVRRGEAYYVSAVDLEHIYRLPDARRRLPADATDQIANAYLAKLFRTHVCEFAHDTFTPNFAPGKFLPGNVVGLSWSSVDNSFEHLPTSDRFRCHDVDQEFELAVQDRITAFQKEFVSIDGALFALCDEPRIELRDGYESPLYLSVALGRYGPNNDRQLPAACFPVDCEAEARDFAAAASSPPRNPAEVKTSSANLTYHPYDSMPSLDVSSLVAAIHNAARNATLSLLGEEFSNKKYADRLLFDTPLETVAAIRQLASASSRLKDGVAVDADELAGILEMAARAPGQDVFKGRNSLPLSMVVDRWNAREVLMDFTPGTTPRL